MASNARLITNQPAHGKFGPHEAGKDEESLDVACMFVTHQQNAVVLHILYSSPTQNTALHVDLPVVM